jgi:hypothetical protein
MTVNSLGQTTPVDVRDGYRSGTGMVDGSMCKCRSEGGLDDIICHSLELIQLDHKVNAFHCLTYTYSFRLQHVHYDR